MTVANLISILENFDEDMEVMIGKFQNFGSDFVYEINDADEYTVNAFWGDDYNAVLILQGSQEGVIG